MRFLKKYLRVLSASTFPTTARLQLRINAFEISFQRTLSFPGLSDAEVSERHFLKAEFMANVLRRWRQIVLRNTHIREEILGKAYFSAYDAVSTSFDDGRALEYLESVEVRNKRRIHA